eukprot:m.81881 g.81881  ORF g.81881 m.81881 type:complete len:528 (+) comp21014_c0_seq3:97-1680(+)
MTPSQCGRMDQGCAYGARPILMKYDGEFLDVEELHVSGDPLYYVLVDLQGSKSTTEILKGLQSGFPFPKTEIDNGVHELLGSINLDITKRASKALQKCDAAALGKLMSEAQAAFDRLAQPACPSQLTMPLLHKVLTLPALQPLIWGGKGVGSQGDGTAQLLCKTQEAQTQVINILKDELQMPSLRLSITSGPRVRVAVIPAAGFCAPNFPATKIVRAELFPVVAFDGQLKPLVLVNVESLVAAGITKILLVVQKDDLPAFERLFKIPLSKSNLQTLSPKAQEYARKILSLGERVHFIIQEKQEGFGHAVFCARKEVPKIDIFCSRKKQHNYVGNQPFLLMLGHHVYSSTSTDGASCVQQMIDAYKQHRCNLIGLKKTPIDNVSRYGAVTGVFKRDLPDDDGTGTDDRHRMLDVTYVCEKPSVAHAKEQLAVEGLPEDEVLTVFGQYIVSPKVFDYLHEDIEHNVRHKGHFSFTTALKKLRQDEGIVGMIVDGRRFDMRTPQAYMQTMANFSHEVQTPLASSPLPAVQ